ncbi:acyl-CoA carboxylase epsilon subunit [Streptosporangium sp. NPDC020072]|uniref:acyl-CoA carboxylase epsilon subunit n=1 Tax=Streptosporangium sp. NPDC020072 TaxID=3154788 RepID=UPI00343BB8DB
MSSEDPLLVMRGKPSEEELAAVVVAFLVSRRQARDGGRPPARRPFWVVGPAYRVPSRPVSPQTQSPQTVPSQTVPSQTARRG